MSSWFSSQSRLATFSALIVGTAVAVAAFAQNGPPPGGPPGGMPSPAEQAIEYRQALYTVLAGNFMPIGGMMQGHAKFDGAAASKHADRLAYIATMLSDAFPDISKAGHTKAKPEIWTHREDFDKKLLALVNDTATLSKLLQKDKTDSAAFKKAAGAVGQDCKNCHDDYKAKSYNAG